MNNNSCCCETVKTTNIKVVEDKLIFVIPNESLYNGMVRKICLTDNVPDYTSIPSVYIQVNGVEYSALATNIVKCDGSRTCTPNKLYADQLEQEPCGIPKVRNRRAYTFVFATDTQCWNLCKPVRKSCGYLLAEVGCASESRVKGK